jgi:hypothetical protein
METMYEISRTVIEGTGSTIHTGRRSGIARRWTMDEECAVASHCSVELAVGWQTKGVSLMSRGEKGGDERRSSTAGAKRFEVAR